MLVLLLLAPVTAQADLAARVDDLAARLAELEKPGSDSPDLEATVQKLDARLAELEKPGSDSPDLEAKIKDMDARLAELEKPNTDSPDLQLLVQGLQARVAELEKPNSDDTTGESPVAVTALIVGMIALGASATAWFPMRKGGAAQAANKESVAP